MILGGDEFLRTQHGNNNAWCQDNPIELGRLVAAGAERRLPPVRADDDRACGRRIRSCGGGRSSPASAAGLPPEILWHGVEPARPDFSATTATSLAFALDGRRSDRPNVVDRDIYVAMNAYVRTARLPDPGRTLGPPLAPGRRHRPALARGYRRGRSKAPVSPVLQVYRVQPHSMIILVSEA